MYQITFYVPESHLKAVKQAIFEAGAGKIGSYDRCAWVCLGTGQFRPLEGSHPFLGNTHQVETVAEYRVELVCADEYIKAAIAALIQSHPYETPAYSVIKLASF
ncbi:MAG: NGG1p interacting factor NIF3 [Proteobacteria bacterium]|nr:MAG: NGG1p interacting factor NIF3 [Pseudomonadota bacterium]